MIKVSGLSVSYGPIQALRDVSLELNAGEIVALIGSNGAGKTTLLKTISGLIPSTHGKIEIAHTRTEGLSPWAIAQLRVAHCPEGRRAFLQMTVEENLRVGGFLLEALEGKAAVSSQLEHLSTVFPILQEKRTHFAGSLSGGEQQMLVMARALMMRPKILLLDEPTMGLAPKVIHLISSLIQKIRKTEQVSILLVEQRAYQALEISDRAYVLEQGVIVKQGNSKDLLSSADIKAAYLGI